MDDIAGTSGQEDMAAGAHAHVAKRAPATPVGLLLAGTVALCWGSSFAAISATNEQSYWMAFAVLASLPTAWRHRKLPTRRQWGYLMASGVLGLWLFTNYLARGMANFHFFTVGMLCCGLPLVAYVVGIVLFHGKGTPWHRAAAGRMGAGALGIGILIFLVVRNVPHFHYIREPLIAILCLAIAYNIRKTHLRDLPVKVVVACSAVVLLPLALLRVKWPVQDLIMNFGFSGLDGASPLSDWMPWLEVWVLPLLYTAFLGVVCYWLCTRWADALRRRPDGWLADYIFPGVAIVVLLWAGFGAGFLGKQPTGVQLFAMACIIYGMWAQRDAEKALKEEAAAQDASPASNPIPTEKPA